MIHTIQNAYAYKRCTGCEAWSNKLSPLLALKQNTQLMWLTLEAKHYAWWIMRYKILTHVRKSVVITVHIHTKEILQLKRRRKQEDKTTAGLTLSIGEIVEVESLKKNDYLKTHIHLIEILKCIVESNTNETLPLWQAPWDLRLLVGYISICSSRPWSIRTQAAQRRWELDPRHTPHTEHVQNGKTPVLRWLEGWVNGDLGKQGICRQQFWTWRVE